MEGAGIWILVILFYLLQAITKNQQKKRRQQTQQDEKVQPNKSIEDLFNRSTGEVTPSAEEEEQEEPEPIYQKPQESVSFTDLFNPEKLRDILGVPQQEPIVAPINKPLQQKVEAGNIVRQNIRKPHSGRASMKQYTIDDPEVRETVSKVASADITEVDESTADFKAERLSKSDVTSERFDERKAAPGFKKSQIALDYFDEPDEVQHAIILKEILDKPRAYRRKIH